MTSNFTLAARSTGSVVPTALRPRTGTPLPVFAGLRGGAVSIDGMPINYIGVVGAIAAQGFPPRGVPV